jgi:hypothetical protein
MGVDRCAVNVWLVPSVTESGYRPRLDDRCDHNRIVMPHVVTE